MGLRFLFTVRARVVRLVLHKRCTFNSSGGILMKPRRQGDQQNIVISHSHDLCLMFSLRLIHLACRAKDEYKHNRTFLRTINHTNCHRVLAACNKWYIDRYNRTEKPKILYTSPKQNAKTSMSYYDLSLNIRFVRQTTYMLRST